MHFSGPLAVGQVIQALDDALLFKIDRDGAAGARHAETLGQTVNRNDLLCAEQDGAADRHLADRSRTPDRHRIGRLDVALHRRLPSGRENIAEEQHFLVLDPIRDLDRADIGIGNADIFGLAAGITAGQVRIAEEPGGSGPKTLSAISLLRLVRSQTEK